MRAFIVPIARNLLSSELITKELITKRPPGFGGRTYFLLCSLETII
jgi:hypothetical protein